MVFDYIQTQWRKKRKRERERERESPRSPLMENNSDTVRDIGRSSILISGEQ